MGRQSRLPRGKKVYILLAFILFYILFETWISYHWLTVNTYAVQAESIDEPVRLVVIADLHDHEFGDGNERLIEAIAEQSPDLILMDGDMLNADSENANRALHLVERLSEVAPVFYAMGNHELDYMAVDYETLVAEIESAGAVVLEQEYQDIQVGDTKLRLGGLYDYAFALDGDNTASKVKQDVKSFLEEFEDTTAYKVMLSHRPDSFIFGDASEYWDVDLVVSAHNHGGQVVLPFLGGVFGGDQGWFPEYIHGLYDVGNMKVFATSGLGSNLKMLPRWNNPPEIAVIELTAQ